VGLVFVAAFAPDDDERLGDVTARSKNAILGPALLQRKYPIGRDGETGVEFVVNPARFHEIFAADLPADRSALLAAGQRPVAQGAFSEKAGPPAWRSIQSWAVVATGDKAATSPPSAAGWAIRQRHVSSTSSPSARTWRRRVAI
jgi:hypothetical protein